MIKKNLKYQSPGINEENRYEKLHTVTFDNSKEASILIAREICDLVKSKQEKKKNCVIGFATGSSPTEVYQEIIRIHNDESLSFNNVVAFNLDEYFPIEKDDKNSYHAHIRYCTRNFLNASPANITFSNSTPIEKLIRTSKPV